jgi:hypothetical protein
LKPDEKDQLFIFEKYAFSGGDDGGGCDPERGVAREATESDSPRLIRKEVALDTNRYSTKRID